MLQKIMAAVTALLLWILPGGLPSAPAETPAGEEMTLTAFNVGKADCLLLRCGENAYLIDTARGKHHEQIMEGLKKLGVDHLDGILITHMDSDHVGGLGMLIHYCFYVLHIPVLVIAPSSEVADDILFLTQKLDGCDSSGYTVQAAENTDFEWFVCPVATEHTPQLEGRCFGFVLSLDGRRVVFTGDTCTLEPFMQYLSPDCELYTEMSAYASPVHLFIGELEPILRELADKQVKIFFMHTDDEKILQSAAKRIGAHLAPLFEE
jgi:glyoxylase-like metal-dependent hydrolase (beta-lactamase superfamily II)